MTEVEDNNKESNYLDQIPLEVRLEKRFDKIDDKLEVLAEHMLGLARAEEKVLTLESDRKILWSTINELRGEIEEIRTTVSEYKNAISTFNRLLWSFITIGTTGGVTYFLTTL